MALFLSVAALLLAISAVVVSAEALRRINGQNEEFLKSYVKQIRVDLDNKDGQLASLKQEVQELRRARQSSQETLRKLEKGAKQKRENEPVDKYGDFIPSSAPPRTRSVA
ncbi:MAG: hypothetical protein HOL66_00220 [Rhodospirillaceae bacterium]|jgi:peptidoglycan hydrolase CwlO-like protein|nr:hypothetical protein [Rhodospirillaceae bacterium]MBT5242647.1 hypothetical protein [Rhodospirillaceae bacterium]MBT5562810.1 hypothetical protein [Rhodospirillaceae bacterium]MBT6241239.1 hypothetical protein [Rhodospirillaceae bacterium]MBT7138050.1 hypothetical protein [Rhodospirillaceae bacterium]